MRVVIDGSALRDGRRQAGIGRYVSRLAAALSALHDIRVSLVEPPVHLPESWVKRYVLAQPWIVGQALAKRATILHAPATDPVAGWPLSRQVVTVHDVMAWTTHAAPSGTWTARYLEFQRKRFAGCAAIIAVSAATAAEATTVLGLRSDRVHVVPHGIEEVFRATAEPADDASRRQAGVTTTGYVLWVGSLRAFDARKALDVLVDAAGSLQPAPSLVFAGADGPEADRVRARARERGLAAITTGYVSDETLAALYRGAGVVAVPSLHEGFGFPVLEAFACGAAVVTTSGGNLAELAGDSAIVVRPGDARELAGAIGTVLGDDPIRRRLREAGTRRARDFTWARAARATAGVYRSVAER